NFTTLLIESEKMLKLVAVFYPQNVDMANLNAERLHLQMISLAELDHLFALQSNEQVARYNTIGIPENKAFTETLIKNAVNDSLTFGKTSFWWAIILKDTQQFIGEAGLNLSKVKYKSGEIFYSLHTDFWRKGYGTETVETILNYAFIDLNLHRITAGVATENVKSIQLLERVGMQREGKHRKILPIRGEWWDNYEYAILEEDFFKTG
ncbi:MAG: GNAT family protein, partial [Bacteroidota bacterium]